MFRQELSSEAAKAATDTLLAQENGTKAYRIAGLFFIGCGAVWSMISLIPIMCGEPIRNCIWMWIVAAVQIIAGAVLVVLCNKSERFRKWADNDLSDHLKRKRQ